MAKYVVLKPVIVMSGGKAVHHTSREVGTVIEVDDRQAKPFIEVGILGVPEAVEFPPEEAEETVPRRRPRRSGDDDG